MMIASRPWYLSFGAKKREYQIIIAFFELGLKGCLVYFSFFATFNQFNNNTLSLNLHECPIFEF